MRPSVTLLKLVRIPWAPVVETLYKAPPLESISFAELPNNAFETENLYYIKKTAFGHWPVYKKIQNTRVSTEIKRVEGDVTRFADDLKELINQQNLSVMVSKKTGSVNIKGDHVHLITQLLDAHIKSD